MLLSTDVQECRNETLNHNSNLNQIFEARHLDNFIDRENRTMYIATTHANHESVWVYIIDMNRPMQIVRSNRLVLNTNHHFATLRLTQFLGISHAVNSIYLRVAYDGSQHFLSFNFKHNTVDAFRMSGETGYLGIHLGKLYLGRFYQIFYLMSSIEVEHASGIPFVTLTDVLRIIVVNDVTINTSTTSYTMVETREYK